MPAAPWRAVRHIARTDPDLEPSIVGSIEWRDGACVDVLDDREGGDVLDEGEPSLGWTHATQQDGPRWLANDSCGMDHEAEHDGREPDPDFAPSLGASCRNKADADLESDGLENGEFDYGDYDANLHIPGGGYHI